MAGLIVGFYGYQRSGKTLLSVIIARTLHEQYGVQVYTNMNVEDFIHIKSLSEVPFDYEPKILLLDEVYYFMDSRLWKNNSESSIFFNTLGKQNVLFLFTAISPDMVEKRIRNQQNYFFISKGDETRITYKMVDVQRQRSRVFKMEKNQKIYDFANYATQQVPDFVDCDVDFKSMFKN
ncbi:MAG: hypothetical protein J6M02_05705 [Clostridia bacterium]|nr:hypothetical protein [Clostridia bacterium]